jgi:tRNA (cmo5U34)-methyltransferase
VIYDVAVDHSEHADISDVNLWRTPQHALEYLGIADAIPHRTEGESTLLEFLPRPTRRFLDLGSGDGRLLALVRLACPGARAVAVDFSDTMLDRLRARFSNDSMVDVLAHDLNETLPDFGGPFDAIVSSFAVHHLTHRRKRALYQEIFGLLTAGGVWCNLEHVASPTGSLHADFLTRIGFTTETEDPSNKLLDVESQLGWLREIGFADVDCHWKWRELALLAGRKP